MRPGAEKLFTKSRLGATLVSCFMLSMQIFRLFCNSASSGGRAVVDKGCNEFNHEVSFLRELKHTRDDFKASSRAMASDQNRTLKYLICFQVFLLSFMKLYNSINIRFFERKQFCLEGFKDK